MRVDHTSYVLLVFRVIHMRRLKHVSFLISRGAKSVLRLTTLTSSSAIAERPRCRVRYFWPKMEEWELQAIFCGQYRSIFNQCDI